MFKQQPSTTTQQQARHFRLACSNLYLRVLEDLCCLKLSVRRITTVTLLVATFITGAGHTNTAFAEGKKLTRAEAVEIAKQRSRDGRVLSVKKTTNKYGASVYAVKIISNGRVKVYAINENSE